MNPQEASIQSINQSIDGILKAPKDLPESILHWKPDEDVWSIMEILCHVEEVTPYWLNELQQVIASPGMEWGRGIMHEGRLAAVAKAAERSKDEVLNHIDEMKQLVQNVLLSITVKDLSIESPSRNPRFGTKPMSFIVDHLLVEHLDKHLNQIHRNLNQYENK